MNVDDIKKQENIILENNNINKNILFVGKKNNLSTIFEDNETFNQSYKIQDPLINDINNYDSNFNKEKESSKGNKKSDDKINININFNLTNQKINQINNFNNDKILLNGNEIKNTNKENLMPNNNYQNSNNLNIQEPENLNINTILDNKSISIILKYNII